MSTTNVPFPQWTTTGLVVPSEAAVLAGVLADFNAALGGNLNITNLQTPQGQLATAQAACISNCYALFAQLVDQVNPDFATSWMQDAIGRIYFMNRLAATSTLVQCNCIGLPGTVIPAGSTSNPQAYDTAGNLYYAVTGGTIPGGGTLSLQFANVVTGPIPCASGTLTSIYQAVTGWDQITNPSAGTLGTNVQSAESFEYQRELSVQANAQGTPAAIYGAVAAVPGVTAVFVLDNDTNSTVNYGPTKYSLPPNSTYVSVAGNAITQAVAQAIWSKKGPGCSYAAGTGVSATVYDTTYPAGSQPAYTVSFNEPTALAMSCVVTLSSASGLPGNINTLIQNAILSLFQNGQQASATQQAIPPVSIASLILAANYFPVVLALYAGIPLVSITWGTLFTGTGTVATSTTTTLTVNTVTSGFLAPGDIISMAGVPSGTYIVQQLTGSVVGSTGTYQMSAAATANESGVALTSTTGNNTQFQAGIDQLPVLSATNISIVT